MAHFQKHEQFRRRLSTQNAAVRKERSAYGAKHALMATQEQVFFTLEVRVKGRPAHIGTLKNLLYGDLIKGLFSKKSYQSMVQCLCSALHTPIVLFIILPIRHLRLQIPNNRGTLF